MERDQAAALNAGRPTVQDPSEADRIKAIYRSYDTQERWLRKRDPANPGFSQSYPITLLPPVARSLCRRWPGLYQPLVRIRPLRSHCLSVVTRPTT